MNCLFDNFLKHLKPRVALVWLAMWRMARIDHPDLFGVQENVCEGGPVGDKRLAKMIGHSGRSNIRRYRCELIAAGFVTEREHDGRTFWVLHCPPIQRSPLAVRVASIRRKTTASIRRRESEYRKKQKARGPAKSKDEALAELYAAHEAAQTPAPAQAQTGA